MTDPTTARIRDYYRQTWLDYRVLWLGRRDRAFHFGHRAPGVRGHGPALLEANRTIAERAAIGAGDCVLDCGCGIGGSAMWLARERGAWVLGLTLVPEQARRGHVESRRRALARQVRLMVGDFTRCPARDDAFAAAFALESLCHCAAKASYYDEMARILRPGGRLVVAEYMRVQRPLGANGEDMLREWCDGWVMPDLDTPEEHHGHAERAGLIEVHVEDFTERVRPSLRRLHRIARWAYPLAWSARRLGLRSARQHGNVRASLLQYDSLQRGDWRYGVLSARKPV